VVAVLVTGMSGSGKSTALEELARRGFRTVDTDHDGFSAESWSAEEGRFHQRWREELIDRLLTGHAEAAPAEPLFVAGCVSNQGHFYPRFAAVVLLTAPADVLLHRVANRTTNPFGKSDEERGRILADLATVEPLLRQGASAEIDSRATVAEVADRLLLIARDAG
jgi:shikimate kinase